MQDSYYHIQRYGTSIMLSIVFGQRVRSVSSPIITSLFGINSDLNLLIRPGATPPLDILPFLKMIPKRWAPWKARCDDLRARQRELYFQLLTESEVRIQKGQANGCHIETILERADSLQLSREEVG